MESLTRRQFLKGAGAVSLATILGACKVFPDAQEEPVPDPKDYLPLAIEYDDSVDLSDSLSGMTSNEKTVHICTPVDNSLELSNGIKTGEFWLVPDTNVVKVFYRDVENIPSIQYGGELSFADFTNQKFGLEWRMEESQLKIYLEPIETLESLDMYFGTANGEIHSLGIRAGLEEPNEVIHRIPGEDHLIGLEDTDYTMQSGVIVKSPRIYGASDKVRLNIPLQ